MISNRRKLCDAILDYRYLLDRGYSREQVLDLIVNRYMLSKIERSILYRCVHQSLEANSIRSKLVAPDDVKGEKLVIDGFNVIVTTETCLNGDVVFLGDDGVVRDVRKSYRKYVYDDKRTSETLSLILSSTLELKPKAIVVVYDEQVSWSGEIARLTRNILREHGVEGDAIAVTKSDLKIIEESKNGIACTSDIVILERVKRVFDLPAYIINREGRKCIDRIVHECIMGKHLIS